jgi:signal transduction histidine kinase
VWLLYTKGFGRSFPIAIESGRDFLIAAVLASAAAAAGVVVRLAAVRVMGQPFMRLGFDPFDSVLVPYVLPVISGVPLITATIVLYDPDDPWAALLNLWWAFPIYAASSYDLRRRRIAQELRREALARQRLAAIGEVSARIVHQSRHQVGLMGWSIHRLRGLVGRSSPDDIEAAERELDALVEAKDRLGEMLASELLHERDAPEPSTDLHGVDVGTARAGVGGSASAGALVRGVAEQLRDEATRAGVDLRVEVAPGATTGTVAPQLRDVVFNLVDNAIDAAAGAVRIEVSSTDGDQLVRVVDDGPGLAATDADRAFEPFYTTKADGTGMGLAIADALVADLGGSLTYERRDGRTTFVVRLPSRGPGRHDG